MLRGSNENRAKFYENATLAYVAKKTKVLNNVNPKWDEFILFVVVEPFDGSLVLIVKMQPNTNGGEKCNYWKYTVPMENVQKQEDNAPIFSDWYSLWVLKEWLGSFI